MAEIPGRSGSHSGGARCEIQAEPHNTELAFILEYNATRTNVPSFLAKIISLFPWITAANCARSRPPLNLLT
eukprot:6465770-Prymnesium_polylepis.2